MIDFITVLAWVFGIVNTLFFIVTLFKAITYENSITKTIDDMKGIKRTFHYTKPFVIAVVCWAWIFTI